MIKELPQQYHIVLGEDLHVTCAARNDPDAPTNLTFSWNTPNDINIISVDGGEDSELTASSTLSITNVMRSHGGRYKCTVNNGGSVEASFTLVVEGNCENYNLINILFVNIEKPSPPTLLVIKGQVSTLQLTWTAPTNPHGNIDHYKVCVSL